MMDAPGAINWKSVKQFIQSLRTPEREDVVFSEFIKLFISAMISTVAIFGYAYAHHFYNDFGVNINDIGFGAFDYIFRGLFFVQNFLYFIIYFVILLLFCLISYIMWIKHAVFAALISLLFLVSLLHLSYSEGIRLANIQISHVSNGDLGRPAKCLLTNDIGNNNRQFSEMLLSLGDNWRLRFISKDDDFVYLAIVSENSKQGHNNAPQPQALAIPKHLILFCRIFGDRTMGERT